MENNISNSKRGTVKWFNAEKGYGFILISNEDDIFCHFSEIKTYGFKTLYESENVQFEIGQLKNKGPMAVNIYPIYSVSPPTLLSTHDSEFISKVNSQSFEEKWITDN